MALDNDDHNWLNGMGASIVQQVIEQLGRQVWAAPLTHKNGVSGPASAWLVNTSDMVGAILAKPSTVIDPAKLAVELSKLGITVTVDSSALVKALDASLADNFAAIPGAVVSGLKAAL